MSRRRRDKDKGLFDGLDTGLSLEETDAAIFSDLTEKRNKSTQLFQNGKIQIGDFVLTTTHLLIPENVTITDWRKVGDILFRLEGSIQWLIGDWLVYGEDHEWGSTPSIAENLGKEVKSLYDYTYVARNVNFRYRTENLSFGHHKLVASLPDEEQEYWLSSALNNSWTISQMREAIREKQGKTDENDNKDLNEVRNIQKQMNQISKNVTKILRGRELDQNQQEVVLEQIEQVRAWLTKAQELVIQK